MRLYELTWGIYPRRVLIYLTEKEINIEHISIDVLAGENRQPAFLAVNPSGKLPVLQLDNGEFIRQSTAIIEYLEEVYPEPSLSGTAPLERAKTREFMSLINEAYIYFGQYSAHASPAFSKRVVQNADVAEAMYTHYRIMMRQIDDQIALDAFLCGDNLTYADCALFASAQFAQELYKEPIPKDCPKIKAFYERFSQRQSARTPDYPESIAKRTPIPQRSK